MTRQLPIGKSVGTLILVSLLWLVPMCRASLIGTTVTGVINGVPGYTNGNFYDPASGDVPSTGFQNSPSNQDSPTVTIVGGNEFGFGPQGLDTSFSATGFTLTLAVIPPSVAFGAYKLTLTDSVFESVSLTGSTPGLTSYGMLTYGISSDVITINIPFTLDNPPDFFSASFDVNGVPEPSSLVFIAIGVSALVLYKSLLRV